MNSSDRHKLTYIIYCINAFGERFALTTKQAFAYLQRYQGLSFLTDCYNAEHLTSLDDAVDDLVLVCKRNGGRVG